MSHASTSRTCVQMPGVYYKVQSSAQGHMAAKLGAATLKALAMHPDAKRREVERALTSKFPTDVMMDR